MSELCKEDADDGEILQSGIKDDKQVELKMCPQSSNDEEVVPETCKIEHDVNSKTVMKELLDHSYAKEILGHSYTKEILGSSYMQDVLPGCSVNVSEEKPGYCSEQKCESSHVDDIFESSCPEETRSSHTEETLRHAQPKDILGHSQTGESFIGSHTGEHWESACPEEISSHTPGSSHSGKTENTSAGPVETEEAVATTEIACPKDFEYSCHSLKGPSVANEETPEGLAEFDAVILKFMKEQEIPGTSLAVGQKGSIIYTQTYGWATDGVPVRPWHRFRIASITKILTAVGIMRLYEEGRLRLQDRVFGPKGILPQFSPTARGDRRVLRITIKHLLQHSAGWDREVVGDPVYWKHIGAEMGMPEPVDQYTIIQYMMGQKLQFTPGTKHAYSNLGYLVLGRVIEKVTGQDYEAYIQTLLAEVGISGLKLGKTKRKDTEPDEVEYFASPRYQLVDSVYPGEGKVPGPYGGFSMEAGDADGGWISTASNLVKFLSAVDGSGPKKILKPETFKLMLERPSYTKGSAWYGFGLDVTWYRKAWEHSGTLDGATTNLVRDRNGFTWAFLCNYWPPDSDYTSLISYAITRALPWSKIKKVDVPFADVATFDKKYLIKVEMPEEQYLSHNQVCESQGYRPTWINGYQVKGHTFINSVWTNDGLEHISHHALDKELLITCSQEYSHLGYRPVHLDTYIINNELKYAVIFLKSEGPSWKIYEDVDIDKLEDTIKMLKKEKSATKQQCIAFYGGKLNVALLCEQSNLRGWWSRWGLTVEKYQHDFDRHSRFGHLLAHVKPYVEGENTHFSTIWTDPGPFLYTSEYEMSKYRLLNDMLLAAEKKFHPICVSGYEDEGAHKFVAVCIKEVQPKRTRSASGIDKADSNSTQA